MNRTELPPILDALLRAPLAWQTPQELSDTLNQSLDDISDQLCEYEVAGVVDVSDGDEGVVVAFSFRSIRELDLELIDDEKTGLPRWGLRPPRRSQAPAEEVYEPFIETEDVRNPDPYVLVALAELEEQRAERKRVKRERRGLPLRYQDVPLPTIQHTGHAGLPWHEPDLDGRENRCSSCLMGGKRRKVLRLHCRCGRGERRRPKDDRCRACKACKNKPFSRSECCLDCGRWGWDDYFSPKPQRPPAEQTA